MKKVLYLTVAVASILGCKRPSEEGWSGNGTSLFSIDSSGLTLIPEVTSTVSAGDYSTKNDFISETKPQFGLTAISSAAAVAEINKRCGLQVGMTVVMALSYINGEATGQLGGKAVLCKSMQGEVQRSVEWQEGEICFSPRELKTTQLVRAPGHTDGTSSLMSLTEYCNDYTEFFLAMNSTNQPAQQGSLLPNVAPPTGSVKSNYATPFYLTSTGTTELPKADTTYRGGVKAQRGTLNISLAGSNLSFGGTDTFVVNYSEGIGRGLSLRGENLADGALVRAVVKKGIGFHGFTFSERGKAPDANIMAGEPIPEGSIPSSINTLEGYSDIKPGQYSYALKGNKIPTAKELGLTNSGERFKDRDLTGGEFQIFWK